MCDHGLDVGFLGNICDLGLDFAVLGFRDDFLQLGKCLLERRPRNVREKDVGAFTCEEN
jgi:hypothetical protein